MSKKDNYFENIVGIGSLKITYEFYEDVHPILFLCEDVRKNTYLCQCYEVRKIQKWNLIKIDKADMERLLERSMSIYDVFKEEKNPIARVTYSTQGGEKSNKIDFKDIDELDLPEKDFVLDDEDVEEYLDFFGYSTNDILTIYENKKICPEKYTGYGVKVCTVDKSQYPKDEEIQLKKQYSSFYGELVINEVPYLSQLAQIA